MFKEDIYYLGDQLVDDITKRNWMKLFGIPTLFFLLDECEEGCIENLEYSKCFYWVLHQYPDLVENQIPTSVEEISGELIWT